jgi:hypothetical protein
MPPPHVSLPWPCAVYARKRPCEPYVFSHMCARRGVKRVPGDLRVDTLRRFDPLEGMQRARRAELVVLVAGDVAQAVCVENARSSHRPRFLYTGKSLVDLVYFFNN